MPAPHYELIIRNGTCVLPWGAEATDVGVRHGHIIALGVPGHATADQVIDVILQHKMIMQRPVVVTDTKAIIGRPKERVRDLLGG